MASEARRDFRLSPSVQPTRPWKRGPSGPRHGPLKIGAQAPASADPTPQKPLASKPQSRESQQRTTPRENQEAETPVPRALRPKSYRPPGRAADPIPPP